MNSSGGSLFIPLGNWQNQMRNHNPVVSSMKLLLWTIPDVNRRLFPKNNVKKNTFTWIYIWVDFLYITIPISHHKNTIHIMILCMCQYVSTAYWHKYTIRLHWKKLWNNRPELLILWPGNASNKYPGLRQYFLKTCLNYCNVSGHPSSTQLIHHNSIFLNRHQTDLLKVSLIIYKRCWHTNQMGAQLALDMSSGNLEQTEI